jgi:hypothetical protein
VSSSVLTPLPRNDSGRTVWMSLDVFRKSDCLVKTSHTIARIRLKSTFRVYCTKAVQSRTLGRQAERFRSTHHSASPQTVGTILLPKYKEVLNQVGYLSFVEIAFSLWLLIKGVRDRQPATAKTA